MPPRTVAYAGADLYPKQREAIFDPARISTIEASTKAGKSSGCLAWLFEQVVRNGDTGREFWWVAPSYAQAKIMWERMQHSLHVPGQTKIFRPNQTELSLTFINGARVMFKSGEKPQLLYGQDVWGAVLDEASRMREDAWIAVRSTLTYTQAPVRMIGNVIGRKNWFYELCRQAEMGTPDMAFHRITCWDAIAAGVLDEEEIMSAKRDFERLGKVGIWEQLYLAIATDDSTNPFGLEAIRACLIPDPNRPGQFQEVKMAGDGSFEWRNPHAGWPVAGGVDLAGRGSTVINQGENQGDRAYTAVCLLDARGVCAYLARFRLPHAETEERIAATIGRVKTLVDATGAGDPTVERLQRRGTLRVEGFLFHETSRQDLLEGLNLVIGNTQVRFPDGPLRAELESFELDYRQRGVRYTIQQGHDDCTFALALAVRGLPFLGRQVQWPVGVASENGSIWLDQAPGAGDDSAYWRRQQDDPLKGGLATQPGAAQPAIPLPLVIRSGSVGGRWRGGDS